MRAALLLALAAVTAWGDPGPRPRFTTRDCSRLGARSSRGFPCDNYALFEFAPQSGAGMGSACGSTGITGAKGEAATFTRASVAECPSSDGQTLTQVSNNIPVVMTGSNTSTWLGIYFGGTHTNLALWSRDLSNAAWVKTSMTCTLNATGMRGDANQASTCTSTAINGTVLQTITTAAATRSTSFRVKKVTQTGQIQVTRDNGTTWTDISASLSSTTWKWVVSAESPGCTGSPSNCIVVAAMTGSVLNPTIGFRFLNSGDSIIVDFAQDEDSAWPTLPILTTAASATRAAQTLTFAGVASVANAGCAAVTFMPHWTGAVGPTTGYLTGGTAGRYLYQLGTSAAGVRVYDGVNDLSTGTSNHTAGQERRYRSTWTGSTMTLTNVTDTGTVSGAFSGTMSTGTLEIGAAAGWAGGVEVAGVLKGIQLDPSTTRCQ